MHKAIRQQYMHMVGVMCLSVRAVGLAIERCISLL